MTVSVSVIIVNYNAAALTARAVASLEAEHSGSCVEVIVVDNSQAKSESDTLRRIMLPFVQLIVNQSNEGFGKACNQAYALAKGRYILLLNPDAYLLPHALPTLVGFLDSRPRAGAVGPRIYWDEALEFLLPPSINVSPIGYVMWDAIGKSSRLLPNLRSLWWRRYVVRVLHRSSPTQQKNLSGGHVLLRREAIEASGGLFDLRFFMYYEDADLFMRMRNNNFELYIDPRACVVHHYNQCVPLDDGKKPLYMQESWQKYVEKYDPTGKIRRVAAVLERHLPKAPPAEVETLGVLTEPLVFVVPRALQRGWIIECSPNPSFIPSAIKFGNGPTAEFSHATWRLLMPGRYYARLGGADDFFTHTTVQWDIE